MQEMCGRSREERAATHCLIGNGTEQLSVAAGVGRAWIAGGGFTVEIASRPYEPVLQLERFYDPKGERMRA
jgi:hypothetical protein